MDLQLSESETVKNEETQLTYIEFQCKSWNWKMFCDSSLWACWFLCTLLDKLQYFALRYLATNYLLSVQNIVDSHPQEIVCGDWVFKRKFAGLTKGDYWLIVQSLEITNQPCWIESTEWLCVVYTLFYSWAPLLLSLRVIVSFVGFFDILINCAPPIASFHPQFLVCL